MITSDTHRLRASTSELSARFAAVAIPIYLQHGDACLAAVGSRCFLCDGAAGLVFRFIHAVDCHPDLPRVQYRVYPICNDEPCWERARRDLLVEGPPSASRPAPPLSCRVCGELAGCRKCTGCRGVAYCGKAHQRQDWPAHKAVCVLPPPSPVPTADACARGGEEEDEAEPETTLTYSAIINTAGPQEPSRNREFSREEVLDYLLRE
ncbi:hypothetical protein PG991_009067 [Apiospora marii]|uniref:MYND-type domain-containing protein n=1 Tax=Apiospora marii TaxID=335849 RepID=A0ABR1RLR4_9PEZI